MHNKSKSYLDLAHKNLADTIENRVKNIKGGAIYKTENYMLYTIGIDTTDGHLNGVISFNDDYAHEIIEKAEEFFSSKGFSYSVWVRDLEDSNLEKLLKDKELKAKREPGSGIMVIDKKVRPISIPKGYTLKTVNSLKEIEDFKIVLKGAFDKTDKIADQMLQSKETLVSPKVKAFIIYNNKDEPVSAAITSLSHKVAGIYYVGTLEKYRGLGLGNLIVEASTNAGFDEGKKAVILQASKVGEIVYTKLAYEKIGYYRSYPIEN